MNKKNDILESWIMVEHLSEGDINLKDKAILNFNDLQGQDYYSLLADEIQKKGLKKNKHSGVIIYFDIFPFQEVIDFLREEYKLAPTEQEITSGNKFSFATVYKGNIIKNLIMDCQSYTKYRPNETTGGIFVSWRRTEELPTGA